MGCSAAKNITVEPVDTAKNGSVPVQNDHGEEEEPGVRKESIPLSVNEMPPIESEEPPADILETPVVNNLQQKGSGLSFELAFEEENEESIIKKHPPKRFQSLEDRESIPVTLEKLQEKLEGAEVRRQQILAQRLQSARQKDGMKREDSQATLNNDEHHQENPFEEKPAAHESEIPARLEQTPEHKDIIKRKDSVATLNNDEHHQDNTSEEQETLKTSDIVEK